MNVLKETVEEVKITSKNEHENKCSSCAMYIVLFSIFFIITIGIGIYYLYSQWYLKKYVSHIDFDIHKETMIY